MYFDETKQSAVCPHSGLDRPASPDGGLRMPADAKVAIEEAFKAQDQMALYRMMAHGNPAVRLYATRMSAALDDMTAKPDPALASTTALLNLIGGLAQDTRQIRQDGQS